ncbi:MAG: hypothetical protein KF797_10235 [Flavobacteriales bacterium]|nr:hypothetical protein [Flavobacteriales bacterium]
MEGIGIPKVLHYIWIGGAPLPPAFQANIDQWQRLMPDYRIMRWDEGNYDMCGHQWVRKRYAEKGYAFASDYMRLDILHRHGGIYLDTDTEIKKRLDPFLGEHLMVPFEFDCHLSTGVIAARKGHPFLLEWMSLYDRLDHARVSNDVITRFFLERFPEFRLNNRDQLVGGDIRVLPKEYFTVPSFDRSKNFGVNQCANSWNPELKSSNLSKVVRRVFGDVIYFKLLNIKMNWKSEYKVLERQRQRKAGAVERGRKEGRPST